MFLKENTFTYLVCNLSETSVSKGGNALEKCSYVTFLFLFLSYMTGGCG